MSKGNSSLQTAETHRSVRDFEEAYGSTPDCIRAFDIVVEKRHLLNLIIPRPWINDDPITAMMNHLDYGSTVDFSTSFVILLRRDVQNKWVVEHAEFIQKHLGQSLNQVMSRLRICRSVPILLFESSHWVLAVLHKPTASVRIYDSLHNCRFLEDSIGHSLKLANSMNDC